MDELLRLGTLPAFSTMHRALKSPALSQNSVEGFWRVFRRRHPTFTLDVFFRSFPSFMAELVKRIIGPVGLGWQYSTGYDSVAAHVPLQIDKQAAVALLQSLFAAVPFPLYFEVCTREQQPLVQRQLATLDVDQPARQGTPRQRNRSAAGTLPGSVYPEPAQHTSTDC